MTNFRYVFDMEIYNQIGMIMILFLFIFILMAILHIIYVIKKKKSEKTIERIKKIEINSILMVISMKLYQLLLSYWNFDIEVFEYDTDINKMKATNDIKTFLLYNAIALIVFIVLFIILTILYKRSNSDLIQNDEKKENKKEYKKRILYILRNLSFTLILTIIIALCLTVIFAINHMV